MAGSRIQRELALLVTGKDVSASKALGRVDSRLRSLERHSGKAFRNISRNIESGIVLGAGAAVGAIGYAVKAAVDWESAWAGVNKTVEGTPAQLQKISDGIRAMSRTLPVSAVELAAIAENAGALGIKTGDILEFTRVVALIGTTTNVTTDEAATALGQLQNVLGLTGQDFDNFAASLVDLGNKGASTEADILEIARRSGGAAKLIGVAKDQTLGWASAAANLGINQELAGTSLQNFFVKALNGVSGGGDKLSLFAKTAGKSASAFQKAFKKDASGALEGFLKGLGKMPKDARLTTVQKLFGKGTGLTRLVLGLADSFDRNLDPSLDTSRKAWKDNTAAAIEAEKRYATTASQLQIFQNNVQDAAITVGSKLLPVLAELSKEGVDWIEAHQPEIQKFAEDLASGIKEAVTWVKSLDWDAITGTLQAGAGLAKGIVEAFVNAPPWVQQLLAGGFVANKFTGGVVGDIAGEIGKGLIREKLGINAGVVNVNGKVVNGGGAGGTGGGGGLLSTVGKVFIVGMAAAAAVELAAQLGQQSTEIRQQGEALVGGAKTLAGTNKAADIQNAINAIDAQLNDPIKKLELAITDPLNHGLSSLYEARDVLQARLTEITKRETSVGKHGPDGIDRTTEKLSADTKSEGIATRRSLDGVKEKQAASLVAFRDGERASETGLSSVGSITRSGTAGITSAQNSGSAAIVAAIVANRAQVTVNVKAGVSAAQVTQSVTTNNRAGRTSSAHGGSHRSGVD